MLKDGLSYEELYRTFAWQIPERFNIAEAVCTRWAKSDPGRTAIIHKHADGRIDHISFAGLERMSSQIAGLLARRGIAAGDRVALLLPQIPETAAVHIAIYKLGAIAVPMAMLFGVEALKYRLDNSGARGLIMTAESTDKIAGIRDSLSDLEFVICVDGDSGGPGLHEQIAGNEDSFDAAETGPDTPALMIYTSGTTGPPKGALHGHRVLPGHLPGIEFAHEFFPQEGDMMWTPSDWAWAGGLLNVLLPSLYYGVPVLAHKFARFDAQKAWDLLAEFPVRNVFIPPTALKMMKAAPPPDDVLEKLQLRTLFSGGEAVGRDLQSWAKSLLGLPVNEVYGQTECNLVLESCAKAGVLRPGAIGKPVPGHTVAIVNDDGVRLPQGETGNIAVKRPDPVMFLEYWGQPEATRGKFAGDWLITGDQGYVDEDGYFYFVGRDDDIITSAGYRIGPGEIEDCLGGHEAVKLAAVIGVDDPVRTQIIKAFIVLQDGFEGSDELAGDIQNHVRTRLSAHEYPREIAFVDDLPLTTTGKIIRRLLRDKG